jgi:hypothetical protein
VEETMSNFFDDIYNAEKMAKIAPLNAPTDQAENLPEGMVDGYDIECGIHLPGNEDDEPPGPYVEATLRFPSNFSEELWNLDVVMITDAIDGGERRQEAESGYVYAEYYKEDDEDTPPRLLIRPGSKKGDSLQYQIGRSETATARVRLYPAGFVADYKYAFLGVHLAL